MVFKISTLPFEINLWNVVLMNSFSIPHPGFFVRDNVIYSHVGLLTIQDPEAMVLELLVWEVSTRRQHFFMPTLANRTTRDLVKLCFLGFHLECLLPEKGSRAFVF